MGSPKDVLRQRFSSDPNKYYRVKLFDDLGFVRKKCPQCSTFFWTQDQDRVTCAEQPCEEYTFLGNPPTPKRLDYVEAWKVVKSFFVKNGHHALARYPVVCRWRPDLYFTVASIVDFQRIESGKVVFEFPVNPIIVPQMCLRFVDVSNVGITGRHYTSFCMIGQQALADENGYWKDRCIELDYSLLTKELGIPGEEIVFKEDVWLGPGAFGNSLEYCVRGLEMGNAVFTSFEGSPENFVEYPVKVVDMGAGLERWAWISKGTPNSYESVFPDVIRKFRESVPVEMPSKDFMKDYFRIAGAMDAEEFRGGIDEIAHKFATKLGVGETILKENALLLQALYSIVDHTRTLVFAISDGALPSNVGGGYNLRVVLRRAFEFANQLKFVKPLSEVAFWHIDQLSGMYPELREHEEDIKTIFEVESEKFANAKLRAVRVVENLTRRKEQLNEERLSKLYDSEGITPETLVAAGLIQTIPSDFYTRIIEMHMSQKQVQSVKETFDITGIEPTRLLFYLNRDQFEFEAKVLKIVEDRYIVLDQTCFYARAGGQEPDKGTLGGLDVVNVIKYNNVVLHELGEEIGARIKDGETITGIVDGHRRSLIMRHHTATHIVNGAARNLIGPWVWQHSAFKDVDMARLDITHFAHLTKEQVQMIERTSNEIVRRNLPVKIEWLPRTKAENEYGFRLYQGGAAPTKELRIVSIDGWDVEACGGTHCSSTGEVGLIKIIKSERVQDGVERLEFVAGEAGVEYVERQESILVDSAYLLETPVEKLASTISNLKRNEEASRRSAKQLANRLAEQMIFDIPKKSIETRNGAKLFVSTPEDGLDSEFHLSLGERVTKSNLSLVYVGVFNENERARIMVFSGVDSKIDAGQLARKLAAEFGGSGGGNKTFGQGGADQPVTGRHDIGSAVKKLIEIG